MHAILKITSLFVVSTVTKTKLGKVLSTKTGNNITHKGDNNLCLFSTLQIHINIYKCLSPARGPIFPIFH